MAVITPSTLTASVMSMFQGSYYETQDAMRTYDQFAGRLKETMESKGNSVTVTFLSDIEPSTTAGSRTADPTPQTVYEAQAVVTTDYYDATVQAHETSFIESFAFGIKDLGRLAGKAKIESVDYLARQVATQGTWVIYPSTHTTRATLDLGTTTDHISDATFLKIKQYANAWFGNKLADGTLIAVLDDFAYGDLLSGGEVKTIAEYQQGKVVLNYELGQVWGVRLSVSPLARAFYGAGATNSTADVTTTLNGAINPLAKTCTLTTVGSLAAGMWLTLGTVESSTTAHPTTEIVYVTNVSGSDVTFHGGGVNGGCRFAHANLAAVTNADTVHPIVIGGPYSLGKVYAPNYGEYGELTGPKNKGDLDQFVVAGYKWWGGYGRINEAQLVRIECSASLQ